MAGAAAEKDAEVRQAARGSANLKHTAAMEDKVGTRTARRRTGRRIALALRSNSTAGTWCYNSWEWLSTVGHCEGAHGEEGYASSSQLDVSLG
jgi:hypothetical protein